MRTTCLWALLLTLGTVMPGGPPPNAPTLTLVNGLNCGSVITTASPGTLVMNQSGTRTALGGTLLGGSPFFALGAFTLDGDPTLAGHPWALQWGSGNLPLSDGTHQMNVDLATVTLSGPATGTFTGVTSPRFQLGLTAAAQDATLNPAGTYTGTLFLTLTDNTTLLSTPLALPITLKVDQTPIAIVKTGDMAFGPVVSGGAGGSVVLDPTGTRHPTGDLLPVGSGSAARFDVSGSPGAQYSVQLPGSLQLDDGAGHLLDVGAFTTTASSGAVGVLDGSSGTQSLQVGATMTVPAAQPLGTYTGSLTVTVVYN